MPKINHNIEHRLDRLRISILSEFRLLLWAHVILQMLIFILGVAFAFIAAGVVQWMGRSDSVRTLVDVWYRFPAY